MNKPSVKVYAGRCMIRPFSVSDLDQAMQIETDSFAFPWSKVMLMAELERNGISRCFLAEVAPGCPPAENTFTAPGEKKVAGYIMSWLVADELHITNLAVSPTHRRLGVAACLVEHALEDARRNGAAWCQLEVRSNNTPAQSLYRKFGFQEIGVRKGYYQDGEDALVLGLDLLEP